MKRFRAYFHYLKPVRLKLIIGILAGVVGGAAMSAGLPLMTYKVFPVIFKDRDTGLTEAAPAWLELIAGEQVLLVACMMLPLVFFFSGFSNYTSKILLSNVGLRVLEQLRIDVFQKLQKLSLSFHSKQKGGDLLSRVMSDTMLLQQVLSRVVSDMITQPGALIGAIGTLVYLSFQDESVFFMLIALMTVPLCVFPIRIFGKRLAKKAAKMMGKQGDISAIVSENLSSQREVRAYMMEAEQVEKLKKGTRSFLRYNMAVLKYRYLISPSVEVVSAIGVGIAIYFGAQAGLTLQAFIPLMMALHAAYAPIKKLGSLNSMVKEGEAALDRIEFIMHSDDQIFDPKEPVIVEKFRGDVEFVNCDFSYGEDVILKDINLSVPAGQTVALVGESGSGKTTFVSLIPRFYEPQVGEVKIDGVSIKDMSKRDLRSQIALVSQHPLLFQGTVAENILIGRRGASMEEVIRAAKNANAHHFIETLPDGYGTVLGERGEGLSGGQRQRIAIARAFLKDAPILILDEATSALDNESEAQIQESLRELSVGRTTFLIAHRFSTIRDAARILVFSKSTKGGKIVADGSHAEVYESSDIYKSMYDKKG